MSAYFCLSFHFPDQRFHGRGDGNAPEWPPSPLRVFQALAASSASRRSLESDTPALQWMEQQSSPVIVAPVGIELRGYRMSVPNNAMDIVAKAWAGGNYSNSGDACPATHRAMKTVRPTYLPDGGAVHYLWEVTDEMPKYTDTLSTIARSISVLGWGIDLVVSEGRMLSREQVDALDGERWSPLGEADAHGLRTPVPGTLDNLKQIHTGFLRRLENGVFNAPPPLSAFRMIDYRRARDISARPFAAFSLLKPDAGGYRAFDTTRRALTLAGMMRHLTKTAAYSAGWSEDQINSLVLGHLNNSPDTHFPVGPSRFAYLPIPSIETRDGSRYNFVGNVRRVIVTAFSPDFEPQIDWARKALSGGDLVDNHGEVVGMLATIPSNEKMVRRYTQPSSSWATVTPLVLPGFDDPSHYRRRLRKGTDADEQKQLLFKLDQRIDGLLRKAIVQAGISRTLADHAALEWRKTGFLPGVERVERYGVPNHLKRFPLYHVRIKWRDTAQNELRVPGPICLGGGRFLGLGLFVPAVE